MAEEEKQGQEVQVQRPSRAISPFDEMERMFEGFIPRSWLQPFLGGGSRWGELAPFEERWPRVDVQDRDQDILVRAEIPGVKKDDLEVSVADNTVSLKASTRREREEGEKGGNYYRHEIATGSFARTVPLPAEVNADTAQATFEDGILTLTLPKQEQSKRCKSKVE